MKKSLQPFIIIIFLSAFSLMACNNYGKKVKKEHIEVFYKGGITMEEAQKTADLLYQADANKGTAPKKSFQLTGGVDTVNFRMVVDKTKMASVDSDTWYMMGSYLSGSVFKDRPVNVELTNNSLKTINTYHYKKMDTNESTAPADSAQ
jgi:hypothetical protein